ncbi:response regulator [Pseudalkalibacillus sp. Hm43]|uniref:response regulator n=1 Tax=Pseudalkalibacillus sp. Hm43 TaxID=3450742 RepID=UPI003F41C158
MPNNAKVEAVAHYKTELLRIVHKLNSPTIRTSKASHMTELYNLILRIQNYCAVFQIKSIKTITTLLIRKMDVSTESVRVKPGEERLFGETLKSLLQELTDYGQGLRRKSEKWTLSSKKKVLVYDQDEWFGEWVRDLEQHSPYQFIQVSADRFKEELFDHIPTAILICLDSGDQQAREWVVYIRKHYSKTIPVIAYTTSKYPHQLQRILELNVTHLLEKPFDQDLLISYLDNAISNQKRAIHSTEDDYKIQRDMMEAIIQKEWMRFQRYQAVFSLVLIKVDAYQYFINQYEAKYHHLFNQLKLTASQSTRPYDELYTWSPGSFMLLLPVTPQEGAETVVERISSLIAESEHLLAEHISFGIIESEIQYQSSASLIQKLETQMKNANAMDGPKIVPRLNDLKVQTNNQRYKILLIDDDLVSSTILFNNLNEEIWEVEVCNEGADALELALQFQPDIILCETKLKDLDGYSFCLQVKQIPSLSNVLFCFLSEQQLKHFIVRAFQIGADDYFLKPFYIEELEVRLRKHLKVRDSIER